MKAWAIKADDELMLTLLETLEYRALLSIFYIAALAGRPESDYEVVPVEITEVTKTEGGRDE